MKDKNPLRGKELIDARIKAAEELGFVRGDFFRIIGNTQRKRFPQSLYEFIEIDPQGCVEAKNVLLRKKTSPFDPFTFKFEKADKLGRTIKE